MSIKLENETGQLILSRYGAVMALGFSGDEAFIERCYNFAYNFCATNGDLMPFNVNFKYVLTTEEKLLKALKLYFCGQFLTNGKIKSTLDEDFELKFDQKALEEEAEKAAKLFYDRNIVRDNFMLKSR